MEFSECDYSTLRLCLTKNHIKHLAGFYSGLTRNLNFAHKLKLLHIIKLELND